MESGHRAKVVKHFTSNTSIVSFTAGVWSSTIYKGYMVVTVHWVEDGWKMRSAIFDFRRFPTPHTGEATCNFLEQVVSTWKLGSAIQAITSDNATDMVSGARKLWTVLRTQHPTSYTTKDMFYVRCISHVPNLAVKECMKIEEGPDRNIRAVVSSLGALVKRKDEIMSVVKELNMEPSLPTVHCETRWSSTSTC